MALYKEHVVFISTDNGDGFGVVIYQDEQKYFYILTCHHILFDNNGNAKADIKVDSTLIKEEDICYKGLENGVDLAVLKVSGLIKSICSMQYGIYSNCKISLITASIAKNDKNTAAPLEINTTIKNKNSSLLYNHQSSLAYEIEIEHEITKGYSGSPLFDEDTKRLIGILNYKADPNIQNSKTGRALCISNLEKILPDDIKKKININNIKQELN